MNPIPRPAEAAPFDLQGKVVLVTGSAKRLGRAIAGQLHAAGARVAIHYRHSEADARHTSELCGNAPVFQADLAQLSEIDRLFTGIDATFGRIDALVNNAAVFARHNVLDVTEAEWDSIHDANLKAYFFCAQHAARRIKAQGTPGRIINISSLGALQPWAEHVPYNASKAGVVMMTRALAKALAPQITVNSVAPGLIPFEAHDLTQTNEGLIRNTPARRHGHADEIAGAVLFFMQASNFITGQILAVDGGLSLRSA
jgi:NAD(P)-dependent dehydrogenase (short-subunit alcohol dehydrogenase family)